MTYFKWSFLSILIFFFCLIKSAIKVLYWICHSVIVLFSNTVFIWFLFIVCIYFWYSHFIHVSYSWFHLSVFSFNSLSYFRWLFWLFPGSSCIFITLGSVTKDLFCFFSYAMAPWFFVFLIALCSYLHIWRKQSPLPVFT